MNRVALSIFVLALAFGTSFAQSVHSLMISLVDSSQKVDKLLGGYDCIALLTLNGYTEGAYPVQMVSSDPHLAALESPVILAPHKDTAIVKLMTLPVDTETPVTLTALAANGSSVSATLILEPLAVAQLTVVGPSAFQGAGYAEFEVQVTPHAGPYGAWVHLSSSASWLEAEPDVFIPAGSDHQIIDVRVLCPAGVFPQGSSAYLTAFIQNSPSASAPVDTYGLAGLRVSFDSSDLAPGQSTTVHVTLSDPCTDDLTVSLASSGAQPALAVPASVVIPKGSTSAAFSATLSSSAGFKGGEMSNVVATVNTVKASAPVRAKGVYVLSIQPPVSVIGNTGSTFNATVTLSAPAPPGFAVTIASDNTAAAAPHAGVAQLTIPAGQTQAQAVFDSSTVSQCQLAHLTALGPMDNFPVKSPVCILTPANSLFPLQITQTPSAGNRYNLLITGTPNAAVVISTPQGDWLKVPATATIGQDGTVQVPITVGYPMSSGQTFDAPATITAQYQGGGGIGTLSLIVLSTNLQSVTIGPGTATPSSNSSAWPVATFNASVAAPPGNAIAVDTFFQNYPGALASWVGAPSIPAGTTAGTQILDTGGAYQDGTVVVNASTADVTLRQVLNLSVNLTSIAAGNLTSGDSNSTNGVVQVNTPTATGDTVHLSTSDPAVTVPASVQVVPAPGTTTFSTIGNQVYDSRTAIVSAYLDGNPNVLSTPVNVSPLLSPRINCQLLDPTAVFLSWTASLGNLDPTTYMYNIYKSTQPGIYPTRPFQTKTTSDPSQIADSDVQNGGVYYYRIVSVCTSQTPAIVSWPSNEFEVEVATAPRPVDLEATPGDKKVYLKWSAPLDLAGPVSYTVYRNGWPIKNLWSGQLTYTDDINVVDRITYKYVVKSFYASGKMSPPSNEVPVIPMGLPTISIKGSKQGEVDIIQWNATGGTTYSYVLTRTGDEPSDARIWTLGGDSSVTFRDPDVVHGHTYQYQVVAVCNESGTATVSSALVTIKQ